MTDLLDLWIVLEKIKSIEDNQQWMATNSGRKIVKRAFAAKLNKSGELCEFRQGVEVEKIQALAEFDARCAQKRDQMNYLRAGYDSAALGLVNTIRCSKNVLVYSIEEIVALNYARGHDMHWPSQVMFTSRQVNVKQLKLMMNYAISNGFTTIIADQ